MKNWIHTNVQLCNSVDLHVRPTAEICNLLMKFNAKVELSNTREGPWICATRQAAVVRLKLRANQSVFIRASGPESQKASTAVVSYLKSMDKA